ncbi:hypothetical protein ACFY4C_07335 [Actinomadura viridis]|uniref:hypothetical protein n=1 Tax=Actinomadura viridis TaxID=58110 RepID=UPI0036B20B7B
MLYVPYLARPQRRLGIAAVECRKGRMYAFGPHVIPTDDVRATAARIAALVSAR